MKSKVSSKRVSSNKEKALKNVKVKKTKIGRGVFARQAFKRETVIGEIDGEVMGPDHYTEYGMDLDGKAVLEPSTPFRFLNHSCEPNCELMLWKERTVGGKKLSRLWLLTIRDIEEGEEMTIDYAWPEEDPIRCLCGAESCRGWVVAAS